MTTHGVGQGLPPGPQALNHTPCCTAAGCAWFSTGNRCFCQVWPPSCSQRRWTMFGRAKPRGCLTSSQSLSLAHVKAPSQQSSWAGSYNPKHPRLDLVSALCHDLRLDKPRAGSAEQLLRLALHPHNQVAAFALAALLSLHDRDRCLACVAVGLASELFITHEVEIDENGTRDMSPNDVARNPALVTALARYAACWIEPLTSSHEPHPTYPRTS
jgi:hypothetical protein